LNKYLKINKKQSSINSKDKINPSIRKIIKFYAQIFYKLKKKFKPNIINSHYIFRKLKKQNLKKN